MTKPVAPCVVDAWLAHRNELKGYLRHRTGDAALADDVLQEVFLKAAGQGTSFCSFENPRAWLYQVARNALVDQYRTARPLDEMPDELIAEEASTTAPVDALAECLERVLAELPPGDAEIIRRCDLQGMKLQAFADAAGLTLVAVKSRIQRARRRLRQLLVGNCKVLLDDAGRVCCHTPRPAGPKGPRT
jgi:RNA polymerase sigma-70 factor, ECF subfamily